jgi:electron transfer flavoprotein beta subunit
MVLLREVWDTRDLVGEVVDADGEVNTSRLTTRLEPEDMNALEMALQIKDNHGGTVTALSVGAARQVDALREALYRGADRVHRISDPQLDRSDASALAAAVAAAIKKLGTPDLFLSGLDVVEGENSHVGVEVAARLGLPRAHFVDRLEQIGDGAVTCIRAIEGGYVTVSVPLPAALIVGVALLKDDPRAPRSAKAKLKLQMKKTIVEEWNASALGLDAAALLPRTVASRAPVPERTVASKVIDAADEAGLRQMIRELKG